MAATGPTRGEGGAKRLAARIAIFKARAEAAAAQEVAAGELSPIGRPSPGYRSISHVDMHGFASPYTPSGAGDSMEDTFRYDHYMTVEMSAADVSAAAAGDAIEMNPLWYINPDGEAISFDTAFLDRAKDVRAHIRNIVTELAGLAGVPDFIRVQPIVHASLAAINRVFPGEMFTDFNLRHPTGLDDLVSGGHGGYSSDSSSSLRAGHRTRNIKW